MNILNLITKYCVVCCFVVFGHITYVEAATCTADASVTNHSDASSKNSIQYCIDDVDSRGGGTVYLGSGTYYTSGSIVLQSSISLEGNGISNTTIRYNGSGAHDILTNDGYVVSDVTIRDLTVRGSGKGSGDNQACIYITDENSAGTNKVIYLRYVKAHQCPQYGVHIKGADGVLVKYSDFENNGSAAAYDHNIYFRRVQNSKIELGTSNYAAGNGLNFTECKDIVVRNFTTNYNGQNGVRFAASEYVKVYSSTSSSNGDNGIEFRTEGSDSKKGCVSSSTIKNNTKYGIYMRTIKGYENTTNTFSGNKSGNELNYSSWSTSAAGVCSSIPTSSSYPF